MLLQMVGFLPFMAAQYSVVCVAHFLLDIIFITYYMPSFLLVFLPSLCYLYNKSVRNDCA